ncbi:MAG TPA: DUF1361 domain-containing protein [Fluviicola sp.]|nr:DUF1361 domain-containing protein [Fluviicola sp.]
MLARLKEHDRLNESILLFVMTTFCFGLYVFRVSCTHSPMFLFLNWNLFLAFIPWALSSLMIINPALQQRKIMVFLLMGAWLLFFPNAPYIFTDLFHLHKESAMPMWFDLVLILSFAWTGLLFGFLSLWDMEKILRPMVPGQLLNVLISGFLFLSAFGIYLGRYLRWNSWDILHRPGALLGDVGDRFIHPFDHPRTWGVTFFMGLLLNLIYWSFKLIRKRAELV